MITAQTDKDPCTDIKKKRNQEVTDSSFPLPFQKKDLYSFIFSF